MLRAWQHPGRGLAVEMLKLNRSLQQSSGLVGNQLAQQAFSCMQDLLLLFLAPSPLTSQQAACHWHKLHIGYGVATEW